MTKNKAYEIVDALIADLSDRGGIGSEWDAIDSEIRASIRETWAGVVLEKAGRA